MWEVYLIPFRKMIFDNVLENMVKFHPLISSSDVIPLVCTIPCTHKQTNVDQFWLIYNPLIIYRIDRLSGRGHKIHSIVGQKNDDGGRLICWGGAGRAVVSFHCFKAHVFIPSQTGNPMKTFAYVDISLDDANFKKCESHNSLTAQTRNIFFTFWGDITL